MGQHCFKWQYVLEHHRAESPTSTDEDIELEPSRLHSPSKHFGLCGIASGHQLNYTAPVYSDKEPRGVQCSGTEEGIGLCAFTALGNRTPHLQILDNEEVEARIRALIPQMESWLNGALPIPGKVDSQVDDSGVVFPTTEIDIPLIPVRDLLYKGIGTFTLLRTHKETTTPHNFSRGIYTVLQVDREGKIGRKETASAKSIWVGRQTALSAGLILLITCPPGTVITEASE
ncbi:hypothetical protein BDV59DRAFT_194320 [Aspergillus ambiguus]|uniref:uncharacterized protein n=1 Tax=Aspergillus ambiguus TaxID=176160 RepID=UPI003CCCB982